MWDQTGEGHNAEWCWLNSKYNKDKRSFAEFLDEKLDEFMEKENARDDQSK